MVHFSYVPVDSSAWRKPKRSICHVKGAPYFFILIAIYNYVSYKSGQFCLQYCMKLSVSLRICQNVVYFKKLIFANLKSGKGYCNFNEHFSY